MADACNFRALLQLLMSNQQNEPSLGVKKKGHMEDDAEGTPHRYLRAAGDRTNISPHCHKSYQFSAVSLLTHQVPQRKAIHIGSI